MAGHSKWSNIKHRKAGQDAKRAKVFTKIIRELTVAARDGGGNIEDFDIEHLERTTDRLSAPQTTYRNSYDPTQKEDKQPDIVDDKETKKEKSKGKALTGSPKTVVDTDPKVDYKN